MNTQTFTTKLFLILLGLLLVGQISTIGCSSSGTNPVSGELDTQSPAMSQNPEEDFMGASGGDRTAQLVWTEKDESALEPNNSNLEAIAVSNGDLYNGHINAIDDQNDYYKIMNWFGTLSVYIKLGWSHDAWLNLYVYDSEMTPITYLNEYTSGPKTLFVQDLPVGIYYVRVKSNEGSGDYKLKFVAAINWGEPGNDSIAGTTSIASNSGGSKWGVVKADGDVNDYFQIEVLEDGQIVYAKLDWWGTSSANLNVYLYDVDSNPLANSSTNNQPESFYSGPLDAGVYYIRVKAYAGAAAYELVSKAYTPFVLPPGVWDFPVHQPPHIPWPPDPFFPKPPFPILPPPIFLH